MPWRLHLTNSAIQHLDILPSILAAWSRRDRVTFYDLETGVLLDEKTLVIPLDLHKRQGSEWQAFMADFTAPNGEPLPVLRLPNFTVYLTDDGKMRLYHLDEAHLALETDGHEVELDTSDATRFLSVALDRFLGLSAAFDTSGTLYFYQQHVLLGKYTFPLMATEETRLLVAMSRGAASVFISDGRQIILTDSSGKIRKQVSAHYEIRRMTCSPNGRYVVTTDTDAGVIRVYNGEDLAPTHQRFAIDLVAHASQVQLMADLPPVSVAPNALAMTDGGIIAFAMSGVICVSDLTQMDVLPRPQTLF